MPQLSIETFVSQYFWFIVILLAFYYFAITKVIPKLSIILKTRNKTSLISQDNSVVSSIDSSKASTVFLNSNLKTDSLEIKNTDFTVFKQTSATWVKNNL